MLDNIDINDRTKTPCANKDLGCPVPNFHVCLIDKEDRTHEFPELLQAHIPGVRTKPSKSGTNGRAVFGSPEHIAKVRATQQAKWAAHNAANADRNRRIVADYEDGLNIRQIRAKYGMGHGSVIKILHAARDRGELVMRTKGYMEFGQRRQKAV